jgi:CopG family nickel-responsive transcriptional regulator
MGRVPRFILPQPQPPAWRHNQKEASQHSLGANMGNVTRIGVSLESELLGRFDSYVEQKGYEGRSEAIRDLIRDRLVGTAVAEPNSLVVGTVTLIYNHHTRLLPEKLTSLQHAFHHVVISNLHAHLDGDTCLEVILLRGKSKEVQHLGDQIISLKGVQHGRLVMSSPETATPKAHSHSHTSHRHEHV